MIRFISIVATACVLFVTPTKANQLSPDCNVTMPCIDASGSRNIKQSRAKANVAQFLGRSLSGVHHVLANKVRAIQAACPGTRIVSTIRNTLIAGSGGSVSKHASGRAVDVSGDYRCIYAQLRDWPSYSTDGPRCRHVHISVGESRFRHYRC